MTIIPMMVLLYRMQNGECFDFDKITVLDMEDVAAYAASALVKGDYQGLLQWIVSDDAWVIIDERHKKSTYK